MEEKEQQLGVYRNIDSSYPPPYSGNVPPQHQGIYPQVPPVPMTINNFEPMVPTGVPVVPSVIYAPVVGPRSCRVTCPSCKQVGLTRVEHKATMRTHMLAMLLCFVGCIPCMCIPYCVDSCQSTDHYCAHCNNFIGKYQDS